MTTATTAASSRREPELLGQTVVVIGGSAGIGLETAGEPAPRAPASSSPGAIANASSRQRASSVPSAPRAFDANDPAALQSFFQDLPMPIDHVMVTAGAPHYRPPLEMPPEEARHSSHRALCCSRSSVARSAAGKVRPAGDP